MTSFRRVELPAEIPGQLYLHSLPGRFEPLEACWAEARRRTISAIVCLVPDEEIAEVSPAYLKALARSTTPCEVWRLPIINFGVPEDSSALLEVLDRAAARLRAGGALLVHCAAGIGRTGTFAAGVLIRLGLDRDDAAGRIRAAGSYAERPIQTELLETLADRDRS